MNQDPVRVHRIDWPHVVPSLRLFQAFPLGFLMSALLLGLLLTGLSWSGSVGIVRTLSSSAGAPPAESHESLRAYPWHAYSDFQSGLTIARRHLRIPRDFFDILPGTLHALNAGIVRAFAPENSGLAERLQRTPKRPGRLVDWVLLLWTAGCTGLLGTAVARIAGTRFCRDKRTGVFAALGFAVRRWWPVVSSTLLVLLLLGIVRLALWVAEVLSGLGAAGSVTVSIFWPFTILIALTLVLGMVVIGIAWLLSLAAIGVDGCSGSEALSRSISYILSHKLLTIVQWAVVVLLSLAAYHLSGFLLDSADSVLTGPLKSHEPDVVRRAWMLVMQIIPDAVQLTVILTGTTIIYVLLRRKEDGVHLETIDGATE